VNNKKPSSGWVRRAARAFRVWFQPVRWMRWLAMAAVLIIEMTNNNRFFYTFMSAQTRAEPMHVFGLTFGWTWADFDAGMWAFTITGSVFFLSITIVKQVGDRKATGEFWAAVVLALVMSGLASAGSFILDTTNLSIPDLIGPAWSGVIAAALGVAVVAFVLFYIRMDAVDEVRKKHAERVEQGMAALETLRESNAFVHSRIEHKEALALQLAAQYGLDSTLVLNEIKKPVLKALPIPDPEPVKKKSPARKPVGQRTIIPVQ
jgi:hypothetical protein